MVLDFVFVLDFGWLDWVGVVWLLLLDCLGWGWGYWEGWG